MFAPNAPLGFVAPPPPLAPPFPAFPRTAPAIPGPGGTPGGLPDYLSPYPVPNPFAPPTPFAPGDVPPLPLPNEFPAEAIAPGPVKIPYIPPLHKGGQGQGVQYRFTASCTSTFGTCAGVAETNPTINSAGQATYGPCSVVQRPLVNTTCSVAGSFTKPASVGWDLRGFTSSGAPQVKNLTGVGSSFRALLGFSLGNVLVERLDGQPDTAGDPPPIEAGESAPNPARNRRPPAAFVPSPRPGIPKPDAPTIPNPTRPAPQPETDPSRTPSPPVPDRPGPGENPEQEPKRVPPPQFPPLAPPQVVPILPTTIPTLPGPPRLPRLNPSTPPTQQPPFFPPRPPVDPNLPPLDPGEPTREPQILRVPVVIPVLIPPPFRDDCCALDEVIRQGQETRRKIDEIKFPEAPECPEIFTEAQLTQSFCDDVNGELTPAMRFETFLTLEASLGFLSREIADIKRILNPCPEETAVSVAPILLGSGTMTVAENVAYVDILPAVRQVELIITGTVPQSIRLYDTTISGEQQAKFGAITLAYPGVVGGNAPDAFHQWAWTRRTAFHVGEPIRNDRRVRINLKAGLSWVLYDTGLRS